MTHAVDIHVGQKIRQRRLHIGITQKQLAVAIGIKFQQIQKYETGANRVAASRLWEISQALDVQPGYFFEGIDDASLCDDSMRSLMQRKETVRLLRSYYQIPAEQRKHLLQLAKSLRDAA